MVKWKGAFPVPLTEITEPDKVDQLQRWFWLPEVTGGYKGLQGVTRGYRGLQGVRRDYKGLPGVTRGTRGYRQ